MTNVGAAGAEDSSNKSNKRIQRAFLFLYVKTNMEDKRRVGKTITMKDTAVTLACTEPRVLPDVLEFMELPPRDRKKAAILWAIMMIKTGVKNAADVVALHEEARRMQMDENDFVTVLVGAHVRSDLDFVNEYLKTLPPASITARIILNAIFARNIGMLTFWSEYFSLHAPERPKASKKELQQLVEHKVSLDATPAAERKPNALLAWSVGTSILVNKNPK
jgi:hypothetical protein